MKDNHQLESRDAGDPPVRFGGRGDLNHRPYPYPRHSSIRPHADGTKISGAWGTVWTARAAKAQKEYRNDSLKFSRGFDLIELWQPGVMAENRVET
jgi:hypothetical protein